jgi:hypothetical protein
MGERAFIEVTTMKKVLRGYAKDRNGNLILIGTIPVPHSKDKPSPRERQEKAHLIRQGATIFGRARQFSRKRASPPSGNLRRAKVREQHLGNSTGVLGSQATEDRS